MDPADANAYAVAMNGFGLDVWQSLRGTPGGSGNLAISPASLSLALAMTYGGATGQTADAMRTTLRLASGPDDTLVAAGALVRDWNDPARTAYELSIANRLFGQRGYGFRQPFLDATREHFGAELAILDFEAEPDPSRRFINGWVEEQTHDRIRDLIPDGAVDDTTRLVLVNAVYFHGSWLRAFDAERTTDLPFFAPDEDPASVPTMRATGGRYGEDDGVQLLELPYAGEDLAMLVVLPREREGLGALEAELAGDDVTRWAGLVREDAALDVQLPRFRIETESIALREVLSSLGMGVAFTDTATFGRISEPGQIPLTIDNVYHRVFVEVNEEGTEAAAATAVVMVERSSASMPRVPPRFHADHPFLFFLRDTRSGAILFAGRVVDPR